MDAITDLIAAVELQEDDRDLLVDTEAAMATLVDSIRGLPTNPPSLYLDLEGEKLSRFGTISIVQLYIAPSDKTFLVDVLTLADKAFTTAGANGATLKNILEDSGTPKVFFDVRNDSDALYKHFGVSLAGVQDLQLMELLAKRSRAEFVMGLAKCIQKDLNLDEAQKKAWKEAKERGKKLFDPSLGGSYSVFNQRPLSDDIKRYCVQDVSLLPRLWQAYNARLTPSKRQTLRRESAVRVAQSHAADYQPNGRHKALAPLACWC